jgi:DNA recombination protein RmuC
MIVGLVIGVVAGAGAVWLWARGELASRRDALERERVSGAEKLALVERTQAEWESHLRSLTSEALEKSSTSLLERADERLRPIRDTLTRFDEETKRLEEKRVRTVTEISEELKRVTEGQERLRSETGNLVTALRRPDVRGRWGEMQLQRVIELAGMVEHCDFNRQESERDDEGRLLRPDLVVRLPGGKSIVVDSKAPFDAYADAIATDDADLKRAHLARHAAQVRDHIGKLSQKQYWKQFEPAPEFVVMFIDEGLYRAALDQDASLFDTGVEAGVIVASPATLIALLRTVAYGWQQETVTASAREIAQLGRQLYERLGTFSNTFANVGKALDKAVREYNGAVGSLETRLLVTGRRFPELGAGSGELPTLTPVEHLTRVIVASELTPAGDAVIELPPRSADAA